MGKGNGKMSISAIQNTLGFRGNADNYSAQGIIGKQVRLDEKWQKQIEESNNEGSYNLMPNKNQVYTVESAQQVMKDSYGMDKNGETKNLGFFYNTQIQVRNNDDGKLIKTQPFFSHVPLTANMFDVVEDKKA
jgi:hypothetical protein